MAARRGGGPVAGGAAASAPYSLAATLRAVLSPLILVGVAMPSAADRVVTLSWAPRADGSAPVVAVVVLELLGGGRSNVLLLDTTAATAAAAAAAAGHAPTGGLIQAVGRSVPLRRAARALQSGGGVRATAASAGGGIEVRGEVASSPAADALRAMAADRLRAALTRAFAAVSPAVASAVVAAAAAVEAAASVVSAGGDGDSAGEGDAAAASTAVPLRSSTRVREVTPAQWRYVDDALGRWSACLAGDRPYRPTPGPPASVLGTALLPDDLAGPPPSPPTAASAPTASEVLEAAYTTAEAAATHAAVAREVVRHLTGAAAKAAARVADLSARAAEARGAPAARRAAARLLAYAHTWSPGDSAVVVPPGAVFEDELEVAEEGEKGDARTGATAAAPSSIAEAIPVPADTTPVSAAGALYARATKLDRAAAVVAPRLAAAEADVAALAAVAAAAADVPPGDTATLVGVAEEAADLAAAILSPAGAMGEDGASAAASSLGAKGSAKSKKPTAKGGAKAVATAGRSGQRAGATDAGTPLDVTVSGVRILVGRNRRQNEALTFGRAAPGDAWLHARGVPGSHVLVRPAAGGGRLDDGDGDEGESGWLATAAGLAAYFSASRGSTAVPVDVTVASNVRRPAAGGRGRVLGSVSFARAEGVRTVTGRPGEVEALAVAALARMGAGGG
ncbi:hypothetical protein MMPV_001013 [Pyropia vietnamensis]